MSRRRRVAKGRNSGIPEIVRCILCDEPTPEAADNGFELFIHTFYRRSGSINGLSIEDYWHDHSSAVLDAWVGRYPGTRPSCWWEFDAPRWDRSPNLPVPRQRVGGSGLATHESDGAASWRFDDCYLRYGIPQRWWCQPSEDDLPLFESEAAYLRRHAVLQASEARLLRPVDFEPEAWVIA